MRTFRLRGETEYFMFILSCRYTYLHDTFQMKLLFYISSYIIFSSITRVIQRGANKIKVFKITFFANYLSIKTIDDYCVKEDSLRVTNSPKYYILMRSQMGGGD